jgi:hypothetical protein
MSMVYADWISAKCGEFQLIRTLSFPLRFKVGWFMKMHQSLSSLSDFMVQIKLANCETHCKNVL